MAPLYILVKPVSGNCNLRCKYCFYADVSNNRDVHSYGRMEERTLEELIKRSLLYSEGICVFGFQGGEPTLAGLDFFKKVVEFERKYNLKKIDVLNSIQTNGMLINDEWAKFLKENQFLVGLSLDGIKETNDANRIDLKGNGSYKSIMHAIQLFKKYKVEYNILTVVSSNVAKNIGKIYGFYKRNNLMYQQYIPCLEPFEKSECAREYTLAPELYGKFLMDLFDLWYNDVIKNNFISIRYFENLAVMFSGKFPESCGMMGYCSVQNVIEADGSVYPCDFYVVDKWKLGNIKENSFKEINEVRRQKGFIDISMKMDEKCISCKYMNICRGGCRRYREPETENGMSLNCFCDSYKMFFDYALERLVYISKNFVNQGKNAI